MSHNAAAQHAGLSEDQNAAVAVARALERLVAVIDRELNAEASEGVALADPAWVDAIATVLSAAEASCAVLDRPEVNRVLTAAHITA